MEKYENKQFYKEISMKSKGWNLLRNKMNESNYYA